MKRRSPPIKKDSQKFYCPSCGASAFELVGTHVDVSRKDRRHKSLLLKCFDCQQLFQHQIECEVIPELPVPAEPQEPVVPAQREAVGTNV